MVSQYEIYWVDLNPTKGSEINKIRPCVIISPNSSNSWLNTILVAPITSTIRRFPMRLQIILFGRKAQICLDQMRCVDKLSLGKKMNLLNQKKNFTLKSLLQEYLIG